MSGPSLLIESTDSMMMYPCMYALKLLFYPCASSNLHESNRYSDLVNAHHASSIDEFSPTLI